VAGLSAFRRVDLTPPPPTQVGRSDVGPRPHGTPSQNEQAKAQDGKRSSNDSVGTAPLQDGEKTSQGTGLRGFLGALATGRISLLSGALGFLAQVFGQRTDGSAETDISTATADRTMAPSGATEADASQTVGIVEGAATATSEDDLAVHTPTQVETRTGVGAYALVNRLVGGHRDTETTGSVELTFPLPFGRASLSVDQVA